MAYFKSPRWYCLFVLSFCLWACESAPLKQFEKVNLGHDKSDVLEIMGGPTYSARRNGMDRWTYVIYQDGIRLERQIEFLDGIALYKGNPKEPFITADEQDQLNAEKNLIAEQIERAQRSKVNRTPQPTPRADSLGSQ